MFDILEGVLNSSGLSNLFELKVKEDNTDKTNPWVAFRVKPNLYRIRSFELWGTEGDYVFRIYHASNMNENLRDSLISYKEVTRTTQYLVDYKSTDFVNLALMIKNILMSDDIKKECRANSRFARSSRFEGLELPDVDTAQESVLGQTFTWREIIEIWEDNSEENKLKKVLSQNGVYLQRSEDGKSRYIGSAYGSDGIIGRWMSHLNSNGDAQHLNLFVLENGYSEILFTVIEFVDGTASEIIQKESLWKRALGTINYGPYNGVQLNNN